MICVGIDVSKEVSTVCIVDSIGEMIRSPFSMKHTREELSKLVEVIKEFDDQVKVVMEATGNYHLPVLQYLDENGVQVYVINPFLMSKFGKVKMRGGKTDRIDSIMITSYGLAYWNDMKPYQPNQQVYAELDCLNRQYSNVMRLLINGKLSLINLLDRTMPGVKKLFNGDYQKMGDFAHKYWHFDNITKQSEGKFVKSYLSWAKTKGYHHSITKAKAIHSLAQSGIPTLSSGIASTKILVQESVRLLDEIEKSLQMILSRMQELAKSLPEYDVVRAMNGVGDVLAPRIIASIGDVRRFHDSSALVAYSGVDTPPYSSGTFVGIQRKISKRGSPLLRKTGYEIMQALKRTKPRQDNAVYLFILKKESEGKPKKVAKIAGFNKFLRIYYARVKECYSN